MYYRLHELADNLRYHIRYPQSRVARDIDRIQHLLNDFPPNLILTYHETYPFKEDYQLASSIKFVQNKHRAAASWLIQASQEKAEVMTKHIEI